MPPNKNGKKQVKKLRRAQSRRDQRHQLRRPDDQVEALYNIAATIETAIVNEYLQARRDNTRHAYLSGLNARIAHYTKIIQHWYSNPDNPLSIVSKFPKMKWLAKMEGNKIDDIKARLNVLNHYMYYETRLLEVNRLIRQLLKKQAKMKLQDFNREKIKLEKIKQAILHNLRVHDKKEEKARHRIKAPDVPTIPAVDDNAEIVKEEDTDLAEEASTDDVEDGNSDVVSDIEQEHQLAVEIDAFLLAVKNALQDNTAQVRGPIRFNPLPNILTYCEQQIRIVGAQFHHIDELIISATIRHVNEEISRNIGVDFSLLGDDEVADIIRDKGYLLRARLLIRGSRISDLVRNVEHPVTMDIEYPERIFEFLIIEYISRRKRAQHQQMILDQIESKKLKELQKDIHKDDELDKKDKEELDLSIEIRAEELQSEEEIDDIDLDDLDLEEVELDELQGVLDKAIKKKLAIEPETPSDVPTPPTQKDLSNIRAINQAVKKAVQAAVQQKKLTPKQVQQLQQNLQQQLLQYYNLDDVFGFINDSLSKTDQLSDLADLVGNLGDVAGYAADAGSTLVGISETLGASEGLETIAEAFDMTGDVLFGASALVNVCSSVLEGFKSLKVDQLEETLIAAGVDPKLLGERKGKLGALKKVLKEFGKKYVPAIESIQKFRFVKKELIVIKHQGEKLLQKQDALEKALQKAKDTHQPQKVIEKLQRALAETNVSLIIAQKNIEKHSHTLMHIIRITADVSSTAADLCYLLGLFIPGLSIVGAAFTGLKVVGQTGIMIHKAYQQHNKKNEALFSTTVPEFVDLQRRLGEDFFVASMGFWRKFRHKIHISSTSRHKLVSKLVYSLKLYSAAPTQVDLTSIVTELINDGQNNSTVHELEQEIGTIISLNNSTNQQAAQGAFDIFKEAGGLEGPFAKTVLGFGATGISQLQDLEIVNFNLEQFKLALQGFKDLQLQTVPHGGGQVNVGMVLDKFAEEVFTLIYQYFDMF